MLHGSPVHTAGKQNQSLGLPDKTPARHPLFMGSRPWIRIHPGHFCSTLYPLPPADSYWLDIFHLCRRRRKTHNTVVGNNYVLKCKRPSLHVLSQAWKLESSSQDKDQGLQAEFKLLFGVNENGQLSLSVWSSEIPKPSYKSLKASLTMKFWKLSKHMLGTWF